MGYLDNVFVQILPQAVDASGASNIIYDVSNTTIIPATFDTQQGYVTVYSEERTVDKTKEYFADHQGGVVNLYKYGEN